MDPPLLGVGPWSREIRPLGSRHLEIWVQQDAVASDTSAARWMVGAGVGLLGISFWAGGFLLTVVGFTLSIGGAYRWVYVRAAATALRRGKRRRFSPWTSAETAGFITELVVAFIVMAVSVSLFLAARSLGDGPRDREAYSLFWAAIVAYPATSLMLIALAVRLWANRDNAAYIPPMVVILAPLMAIPLFN